MVAMTVVMFKDSIAEYSKNDRRVLQFKAYAVWNCVNSKRFRNSKFGVAAQPSRSRLLVQHPVSLLLHFR